MENSTKVSEKCDKDELFDHPIEMDRLIDASLSTDEPISISHPQSVIHTNILVCYQALQAIEKLEVDIVLNALTREETLAFLKGYFMEMIDDYRLMMMTQGQPIEEFPAPKSLPTKKASPQIKTEQKPAGGPQINISKAKTPLKKKKKSSQPKVKVEQPQPEAKISPFLEYLNKFRLDPNVGKFEFQLAVASFFGVNKHNWVKSSTTTWLIYSERKNWARFSSMLRINDARS